MEDLPTVLAVAPGESARALVRNRCILVEAASSEEAAALLEGVDIPFVLLDGKSGAKLLRAAAGPELSRLLHDLRSPLSGIVSHLELLSGGLPEGLSRDDARAALRGALALQDSLDDAALAQDLEQQRFALERSPVDVRLLLQEVLATAQGTAQRRGVAIAHPKGAPVVELDGKVLRRALHHLVQESLRRSPRGAELGVSIHVKPGLLEISLADRGEPLSPVEGDNLFWSRTGLRLARMVAEAHGGSVTAAAGDSGETLLLLCLPA